MAGSVSKLPAASERRTASDYVTEALRDAIITGTFADGEELNQVELAEHFNVSRVPIREALRQLQAAGLVRAEAHRRAVVIGFTPARISEIFEVRASLEAYMLDRSVEHITEDELAELLELCDEMDRIDDHSTWLERNHEWHHRLLAPSGATTAMVLVDQLSMQVERYLRRTGGLHRPKEAGREHRQIVQALRKGNVERAHKVLRGHILTTRDRVLASLEESENGSSVRPETVAPSSRRRRRSATSASP